MGKTLKMVIELRLVIDKRVKFMYVCLKEKLALSICAHQMAILQAYSRVSCSPTAQVSNDEQGKTNQ